MDKTQAWLDLTFGLFIHFGLYSLYGGVYHGEPVRRGYSEQILSHGYLPQAEYEGRIADFSIPHFDAHHIVRTAKRAGMRYVVVTAKHHDGFCLFDTATTDYKSTSSASSKDIVKELAQACQAEGLKFGLYYSWIDWHYPHALPISSHNSDAIPPAHMDYTLAQLTELLSGYGEICELWMDMGAPTPAQSQEVKSLVGRLQPRCMVNGRIWNDEQDFLTMGDNQVPTVPLDCPWQTPASIYKETWGYRAWQERGAVRQKVDELTSTARTVVEHGGNYLLNIGLMGDGSIQSFEEEVLLGIGQILSQQPLKRSKRPLEPPLYHYDGHAVALDEPLFTYRYTGSDYYSYRPIATGLHVRLVCDEDATVRLDWQTSRPLDQPAKVCLLIDDQITYASLQQGRSRDCLFSALALKRGEHTISLQSVGESLKRPPLVDDSIVLHLQQGATYEI